MRLSGIAFRTPRISFATNELEKDPSVVRVPLATGYLPIDQYTGIIGRNDTGKTQLLGIIEEALNRPRDPDLTLPGSILFFSCSVAELEALTQQATLDLVDFDDRLFTLEERPLQADRFEMWDRRPSVEKAVFEEASLSRERPAVEQYAGVLREAWNRTPENFSRVIDAAISPSASLSRSSTLTVALQRQRGCWSLYWCVAPVDQGPEALERDLKECLLGPGIGRREVSEGDRVFRKVVRDSTTYGWPKEAPIPVAPVGLVPLPLAPRGLRAEDLGLVAEGLERAFSELAIRTTRLEALLDYDFDTLDDRYDIPGYGVSGAATKEALSRSWFVQMPDGGYKLNPDILGMAKQLEVFANELLPSFIRKEYRLQITVTSPTRWSIEPRLQLSLEKEGNSTLDHRIDLEDLNKEVEPRARLHGAEYWPGHQFPVSQVAQGFKLWIGVALTEAVSIFDIVSRHLDYFIQVMVDTRSYGSEGQDEEEASSKARHALEEARRLAPTIEEATQSQGLHRALDEYLSWERINPWVKARAELHRGLVFLLDEPERHLHPALQREAAEWLQERLDSSGFQTVVATHSLPFMSVSGSASFTYLVREPAAPTALIPIYPRELDSLSLAATELGIDRGELLSLVNLFLWVEGYSEQLILETLFGPELRDLGVYVIPLHGHPGARGIIDSRIHSFTSARTAVWLDAISPEFVAEAQINPEVETSTPEEKTLVQVVRSAQESGIRVVPISVDPPGDDVFDLLDDLAVESEYPDYPGHEEAHRLWAEAREKGAKVGSRKDFWAQKFKTPITPDSCRLIASRMRREGRITPQLASVLEQCKAITIS